MVRYIGIVLVALGLIVQPLIAIGGGHIKILSDHGQLAHGDEYDSDPVSQAKDDGEALNESCHHLSPNEASSLSSGAHSFFCPTAGTSTALVQKLTINPLGLQPTVLFPENSEVLTFGPPSRIFHPPKYS